jgi:hypothetical protein
VVTADTEHVLDTAGVNVEVWGRVEIRHALAESPVEVVTADA